MSSPIQLLESVLGEYRKAADELAESRGKAVKAKADAQKAIGDGGVTDVEAANALFLVQVTEARAKARETEREKATGELERAIPGAIGALNALVRELFFKRRALIGQRVIKALNADSSALDKGELDLALELSPALSEVRVLSLPAFERRYSETYSQDEPMTVTTNVDGRQVIEPLTTERNPRVEQHYDVAHTVEVVETILANFAKLNAMAGKEI